MKTNLIRHLTAFGLATALSGAAYASSHMDAPLITRDPSANTTDVYAFVTQQGDTKYLVVALGVYPHEEPGIGPNAYNFDDDVLYEIHVATGRDLAAGKPTISYQFDFDTTYKRRNTILVSYLDVVRNVADAGQNLVQTYTVTKVNWRDKTVLLRGVVPPNNQGNATPFCNQGNNGENPAKDGVSNANDLDRYTRQAIFASDKIPGYLAFAGQRDDGFFADVQAVFDLLRLRNPGKDSQGGFNLHLMALRIPVLSELGTDQQIAGVYATTSRQKLTALRDNDLGRRGGNNGPATQWVQVGRQGNPLFNEALVAVRDKDLYSRTSPSDDANLFRRYAVRPELARLLNLLVLDPDIPGIETGRTDIAAIYIPDMIKVDLSTGPARLAGSGPNSTTNPDDPSFSRLGIFGTPPDVLQSQIQDPFGNGGLIPGGWPNGRRFGDDVLDIAVSAIISDLRGPIVLRVAGDNLDSNDIGFNKTFPYEGTPQNGRNHAHPSPSTSLSPGVTESQIDSTMPSPQESAITNAVEDASDNLAE
jgi:hypothetical protein